MISWVAYLSIGVLIGIAAGFYFSILNGSEKKRLQELEAKLKEAENQMSGYKQNVTDHFVTTSNLLNNMTDSYRAIYDHMSDGAKTLCSQSLLDSPANQYQLDIPEAKLIETKTKSTDTTNLKSTTSTVNEKLDTLSDSPKVRSANSPSDEEINKIESVAADSTTADKNIAANFSTSDDIDIASDTSSDETTKLTKGTKESNTTAVNDSASNSFDNSHDKKNTTEDKELKKPILYEKSKKQNSNIIH